MFDNFDDLYNKFFGDKKNDKHFKKMFDLMNKLNQNENPEGEKELGEPDDILRFEENGFIFEKKYWFVEGGSIIKIEMVDSPFETKTKEKPLSLEGQLELAISEERYEDAAKLRDEINSKK